MLEITDLLFAQFAEEPKRANEYNCWTFCQEVARRAGHKMISFEGWVKSLSERDRILRDFSNSKDFEKLPGPQPFCIVGFLGRRGKIRHMGMVLEDGKRFIHITRKIGVKIDHLGDPDFADRIYGFYRYAEHNKD